MTTAAPTSQFLIYQPQDGQTRPGVRLEGETAWLHQKRMACQESNT